jgi:hypothetical protein
VFSQLAAAEVEAVDRFEVVVIILVVAAAVVG